MTYLAKIYVILNDKTYVNMCIMCKGNEHIERTHIIHMSNMSLEHMAYV